jgi:predicted ester cyclase
MSEPSPVDHYEFREETLRQAPPRNQAYAADPPQDFFASLSQAPTLKKSPPAPPQAKHSIGSFGVDPSDQMAQNAVTRELVKQFIADIWNRGDLDLIPEVCARGIRFNGSSGMDRVGHEGFKKMVTTIRNSLEDYHCEIHSMVVEGNKAFCRMRFMGRHVGKLLGCEPTGRHVSWMGAMEFTVMDGLIIKVWELGDMASLEQQLR